MCGRPSHSVSHLSHDGTKMSVACTHHITSWGGVPYLCFDAGFSSQLCQRKSAAGRSTCFDHPIQSSILGQDLWDEIARDSYHLFNRRIVLIWQTFEYLLNLPKSCSSCSSTLERGLWPKSFSSPFNLKAGCGCCWCGSLSNWDEFCSSTLDKPLLLELLLGKELSEVFLAGSEGFAK